MECRHLRDIPYREFSKRLHHKGAEEHLPLNASIEITERCNLKCAHCYINQPAGDQEAKQQELGFKEWARLLDEMAAAGCLWLLLTGGEPLLHPDFRKIYTYAKKQGMVVSLFTNGTLITHEIADFLQDLPPFSVEISVYGRSKPIYEAVTRIPGSYEKCLEGIELLLSRQVPLELKSMVMSLNAHELWDLKAWADGLGVNFHYDPMICARLDGGKESLDLRLLPEQVVEFDMADEKRQQALRELIETYSGPPDSDRLYTCRTGIDSFHLDPYGRMPICLMSRKEFFDIKPGTFEQGWQELQARVGRQKPEGEYPCNCCNLMSLCAQCPGWAQLEHGRPDARVAYLCQVAHLRAEGLKNLPEKN